MNRGVTERKWIGERVEFDAKIIAQLEEVGGRELVEELFELYLTHAPARLQEIRRAIGAGEAEQAAKAIHSLRSSSATLGALSLAERLGGFENAALAGGIGGLADRWSEVEREVERFLETLTLHKEAREGRETS